MRFFYEVNLKQLGLFWWTWFHQCCCSGGEAQRTVLGSDDVGLTRRFDRMGAGTTHNHPTSYRGFFFKAFVLRIQSALWWTTGGHVCSLLFEGKLIFLDLVDQVEKRNLFHDEPRCETLSVSVCVFADMCVHSGVLRSTVWSLVLLRWCRVSGPAPLGRGHPPAGTHRSGCWTPLISLHCWLLHTPPPLRIKGIQTPSVLRDTSQATSPPQPSPLLHLIDFHQGPIFLALFPAAHLFWQTTRSSWWPPHLNYNPYETLSTTLRKRQTTHTIASQSSSLDAISSLPLVRNTSSTDSSVVLNPRGLWIFLNGSFRPEAVSWTLHEV